MTQLGSIEAVVVAIHEDAQAELEKIEREVATTIERLRLEDSALPIVVPDADARIAAARRLARDRMAAEDWADHEAALSERERWIEQVTAKGALGLGALDDAAVRADLVEFVREALARMPSEPLELLVPAGHLDFAEHVVREGSLAASSQSITRVGIAPDITSGCVVQTVRGRIRYENSYSSRARRYEAAWRARLGELYERRLDPALAAPLPSQAAAP